MEARQVNITDLIDRSKLGPFQLGIFILFGLCLIMDGYDVQAMGYVAPAIIRDWQIPNAVLGPVFSAGLAGLFLGSLLFGMVADRIGRRPVLLGATLFFAVFTLLTARATSIDQLFTIRFLAGLGLGAILPNATALIGEFSPSRSRIVTMMIVTNGFTIGAMLGGFLAAWLIPAYGWRAVFYFGGAIPLLIVIPMFIWLPESLQFLALRGKRPDEIGKWLRRIDPTAVIDGAVKYQVREEKRKGVPIFQLFREGRALGTTQLWVVNFLNVLNAYFLASWLPTVVRDSGYATSTAVLVGATVQMGGALGTIALGPVMQRIGFVPILTACFTGAGITIAMIGQPGLPLVLLFVVAFLAGLGIFGGQPGLNALEATYYPTDLRSTGIGSALGIGRVGAVIGPLLAGEMMRRQWSTHDLFTAAAIPSLVSAAVIFTMRWELRAKAPVKSEVAVR